MRNWLKSLSALFVMSLAIGLGSCANPSDTGNGMMNPTTDKYSAYDYAPSADLVASTIQDATLNQECVLFNEDFDCVTPPGRNDGYGNSVRRGAPEMMQFRGIFREMQMTEDQIANMPGYMREFINCQMTAKAALRQSEMAIIREANVARKDIMDKLKAGELTRVEAADALKVLNAKTRLELRDNPLRESTALALKDCRDALLAKIKAMLTDEQLVLWEAWVLRTQK